MTRGAEGTSECGGWTILSIDDKTELYVPEDAEIEVTFASKPVGFMWCPDFDVLEEEG